MATVIETESSAPGAGQSPAADQPTPAPPDATEAWPVFRGGRVIAVAGGATALGLIGLVIGFADDPRRTLFAYLTAYVTVAAIAMGALILLLAGHVTNARWPAAVRRVQESITIVFPLLLVLFVPIAVGLDQIYSWVDPPADLTAHERHLLEAKRAWLDPGAFVVRTVIYLAIFTIAAEILRRWSLRRDVAHAPGDKAPPVDGEVALRRERMFSAAMLPAVGLATTFAAFDWIMSLQPTWFSSIFGVYYFAGGFGAGIALLAILAWRARTIPAMRVAVTRPHFHALGRLLFAFVVFWAYAAYFQGFLIQIADRPIEVTFFIVRLRDGWGELLRVLLVLHFAVPFLLLLPRRLKLHPRYIAAVATIVLVAHVLDMYWLVMPAAGGPLDISWIDFAAFAGVVGACVVWSAWRQRGVSLVASGDPHLSAAIHYSSPT